jgi:hypothetical protein
VVSEMDTNRDTQFMAAEGRLKWVGSASHVGKKGGSLEAVCLPGLPLSKKHFHIQMHYTTTLHVTTTW